MMTNAVMVGVRRSPIACDQGERGVRRRGGRSRITRTLAQSDGRRLRWGHAVGHIVGQSDTENCTWGPSVAIGWALVIIVIMSGGADLIRAPCESSIWTVNDQVPGGTSAVTQPGVQRAWIC